MASFIGTLQRSSPDISAPECLETHRAAIIPSAMNTIKTEVATC